MENFNGASSQNPTFSFIIPTLQEDSVIEKLLKNLKSLKNFPYEIIVSDGGSKDKTVEIARRYTDKIIIYREQKRQTIALARNMGAALSSGEYLIFLDADVYIPEPDKFFQRALDNFGRRPNLLGLSGWIRVFPDMETWGDFFGYVIISDCMFYLQNNILRTGATCGEFQMVKRDVFKKIGGFKEYLAVAEDLDLFRRIAKLGLTRTDPELLLYHTGRRPHKIGWPKLLWDWAKNSLHVAVMDKSHDDEWKVIR